MPINLTNPVTKTLLTNYINSIFGGESQQTRDILSGLFSNAEAPGSAIESGDFLREYLTNAISTGLPYKDQFRQEFSATINRAFDNASNELRASLANKGTLRSGIGSSAQIDLFGERAKALSQNEANLNLQDVQFRNQAISKLLGLEQLNLSEQGQELSFLNTLIGGKNTADINNFRIKQNEFDFADLLPGLFQAGGQIGSSFIGG